MRLAIVSLMGGIPWGGSEALWHKLALHALKQGDNVLVSVYKWGTTHPNIQLLQTHGATVSFRKKYIGFVSRKDKILRFIRKRIPLVQNDYQRIIDFKPDGVFINQGESFDLALDHMDLYKLLVQNNISYSLICHSNVQQYSFIPPREIYPGAVPVFKNARHVFFVSHRQWQLTERRLAIRLTNARFTWNPLNFIAPSAPLPWADDSTCNMALVGAFVGYKGHDTALEVLSAPQWKERNWKLNIYGSGEGEKYLKELTTFFGISGKVLFHGHVSDIKNEWLQNHILLIPSAGEGLPISLVEAMACGRPAVVTDVGGNTELIVENDTGFISASPTTGSFSVALEKAWNNKNEWKNMGIKCFKLINQLLDKAPENTLYDIMKDSRHNY